MPYGCRGHLRPARPANAGTATTTKAKWCSGVFRADTRRTTDMNAARTLRTAPIMLSARQWVESVIQARQRGAGEAVPVEETISDKDVFKAEGGCVRQYAAGRRATTSGPATHGRFDGCVEPGHSKTTYVR